MSSKPDIPVSDDVQEIFNHWVYRMGKTDQTKLTKKRKSKIIDRLKDGYTVDYIKSAIDGCAKSPHHMGQNDQGTVYDDIELICRESTKMENFADNIAKITPADPRQPETIAQFQQRSMRAAQDVIDSGFLDDLPD